MTILPLGYGCIFACINFCVFGSAGYKFFFLLKAGQAAQVVEVC